MGTFVTSTSSSSSWRRCSLVSFVVMMMLILIFSNGVMLLTSGADDVVLQEGEEDNDEEVCQASSSGGRGGGSCRSSTSANRNTVSSGGGGRRSRGSNNNNNKNTRSNDRKQRATTCNSSSSFDCSTYDDTNNPSLYRYGGSAQAYKAMVSINTTICDPMLYQQQKEYTSEEKTNTVIPPPHRVASWPYTRASSSSSSSPPPRISLRTSLFSCGQQQEKTSSSSSSSSNTCCCEPLPTTTTDGTISSGNSRITTGGMIEIWQARPDGTYSSLQKDSPDNDDCRTRMPIYMSSRTIDDDDDDEDGEDLDPSSFSFVTVAPGSTGILNGIGPNKFDLPSYGPPIIHIMVSAIGHEPTLINVPITYNPITFEYVPFKWPDWRGAALVNNGNGHDNAPYKIKSWIQDVDDREIEIVIEIYLKKKKQQQQNTNNGTTTDSNNEHYVYPLTKDTFCRQSPWMLHTLLSPSSFFLEPITICSPTTLDFFAL